MHITDGQKCNLDGTKYESVKWEDSSDHYCADTSLKVLTKEDVVKFKNLMMLKCENETLFFSSILFKEEEAKNLLCLQPPTGLVLNCTSAANLYAVCKTGMNYLLLALYITSSVLGIFFCVAVAKGACVLVKRRRLKVFFCCFINRYSKVL